MAEDPMRVLVLCTGNSCRSQMAAGFLNHLFPGRLKAFSAGSHPAERVNPNTLVVMDEVGIDLSDAYPKHLDVYLQDEFDYVITVCDSAAEACPVYPGPATRFHWPFDDPFAARGAPEEMAVYRRVRDEIRNQFESYFSRILG